MLLLRQTTTLLLSSTAATTSSSSLSSTLPSRPISTPSRFPPLPRSSVRCTISATGTGPLTTAEVADKAGDEEGDLKIKELEDLSEQWRRSKVAWLCKELPSHKHSTFTRILNAQRKWLKQEDASYLVVHCLRIRENEAAFRVYKWMARQHWFSFDFPLATRLAECLGKDRKFSKCREVFDEIVSRGRVPSETTFHVLIVAYLSATVEGCLEEACGIYNRMVQTGDYRPRLSLHNSLFRAIVGRPGVLSKQFLNQGEFIFCNLENSGLEIQKDVYAGLIWLHSYQDVVDWKRIEELRERMRIVGFKESRDVLVSVIRAFSKLGNTDEAERSWNKLLELGCPLPSQAFVYRMELYEKVGQVMNSLEIFKGMKDHGASPNVVTYQKIIEVMSKAKDVELAELLMTQFTKSGMKPLAPSFIALMEMYSNLSMHNELETAFYQCLSKCRPNQNVYRLYLDSLVRNGNMEKAENIFNEMHTNGAIGTDAKSCNIILGGFLASEDYIKAEKIFDMMCQKKYDVEPTYLDKLEYVIGLKRKVVKRPVSLKLDQEQREILVGLLLGGVPIETDEHRRIHAIHFKFNANSSCHSVLKDHLHERFYEWLSPHNRQNDEDNSIRYQYSTIKHLSFSFFAEQFLFKGKLTVPKLIHRWLSARSLAYWYMYGGLKTASGDVLIKLKSGSREDVERIINYFLMKSLDCRVKKKGRTFWVGFQGSNAMQFLKLIKPYLLDGIELFGSLECQDSQNETDFGGSYSCERENIHGSDTKD